jgi:type I restriction-modification system DNA methylase subunit
MGLFQGSVLKKYLNGLDSEKIDSDYQRFTSHFHNPVVQENIRNSKEEQYQGEFLIDLFVNVFGYTKNPAPGFNLTSEFRNIKDSKKADGAILKDGAALAVIELKGTNTTDLSKVESQAFGYKNNQPNCNYVIISNFEKLRFYIDNAIDFEEFDLFKLTKDRFEVLFLCLSSTHLLNGIPEKVKKESIAQEEKITNKLYEVYASFKKELFEEIQKENPEYDSLTLFKKSQKLIDRFLFIFFAEDRLLLPPNSISSIINQWVDLRDKYDEYFPLYDRFKKYFAYMNTGHKGRQYDIFAYNGGLFAPDDVLDNIKIGDELLHKHAVNLSNYDFESEVSVNILGHIFEHSLNDIDEIQAKIQGFAYDESKTKRKKEGVFYTPKHITKYIVENTLGKLCEEKKTELHINEVEYEKGRKGRQKTTLKKLFQKLEDYRSWLLQITICDPACGSGAFLNQALEFLITEHRYLDELQAKLFGDAIVLSEIENVILENNLYGVDINEESVEIAKLSLWLRTAQKGRKLTSLNNNIKCGNSLIDDPGVAGDKAFNWREEFSDVFLSGGFDVLIGNPPYVSYQNNSISEEDLRYFNENYQSSHKIFDLYGLFIEKCHSLLKEGAMFSFITPNLFLMNDSFSKLRHYIAKNFRVHQLINCKDGVFKDAVVPTLIFVFAKGGSKPHGVDIFSYENKQILKSRELEYDFFVRSPEKGFNIELSKDAFNLIQKLEQNTTKLGKILNIRETVKTGNDKKFISKIKHSEDYYPMVTGKDVSKYRVVSKKFMYFNRDELSRPTKLEYYKEPKLFIRRVGKHVETAYDDKSLLSTHVLYIGSLNDSRFSLKFVMALLNSPFFTKIYHLKFPPKGKVFPEIRIGKLRDLPIKNLDYKRQNEYEDLVNIIIKNQEMIEKKRSSFSGYLFSVYTQLLPSNKICNWDNYSFKELVKEFKKSKVELKPSSEIKLYDLFQEYIQEINRFKINTGSLKNKIDEMIVADYEISPKETLILKS